MNIVVGIICLVTLAALERVTGLPEPQQSGEILTDPQVCSCSYIPELKGCILSGPTLKGAACQCYIVNGNECIGQVVECDDVQSPYCYEPGDGYNFCMQGVYNGRGNCCGYASFTASCKPSTEQANENTRIVNGGDTAGSNSCRYWCKTPNGQIYCCEGPNGSLYPPVDPKQGHCPPVRTTCTRGYGPPRRCSNDAGCLGVDKCCWDVCLDHHACKPPIAPECPCSYSPGLGCSLSKPTLPGLACRCKRTGLLTDPLTKCIGTVVDCLSPLSTTCKTSGSDLAHCLQGEIGADGNCCGYPSLTAANCAKQA